MFSNWIDLAVLSRHKKRGSGVITDNIPDGHITHQKMLDTLNAMARAGIFGHAKYSDELLQLAAKIAGYYGYVWKEGAYHMTNEGRQPEPKSDLDRARQLLGDLVAGGHLGLATGDGWAKVCAADNFLNDAPDSSNALLQEWAETFGNLGAQGKDENELALFRLFMQTCNHLGIRLVAERT